MKPFARISIVSSLSLAGGPCTFISSNTDKPNYGII